MKKLIGIALLGFSVSALAQTPAHSVTLTWTAPVDAIATSTITVFRASAACSASPTFTTLAAGQSVTKPYVDSTVTVGTYCYTVQQVQNGASSPNSNLAPATVSPLPATGLTVVVQ